MRRNGASGEGWQGRCQLPTLAPPLIGNCSFIMAPIHSTPAFWEKLQKYILASVRERDFHWHLVWAGCSALESCREEAGYWTQDESQGCGKQSWPSYSMCKCVRTKGASSSPHSVSTGPPPQKKSWVTCLYGPAEYSGAQLYPCRGLFRQSISIWRLQLSVHQPLTAEAFSCRILGDAITDEKIIDGNGIFTTGGTVNSEACWHPDQASPYIDI